MHTRRAGALTVIVGIILLLTPLYWGAVQTLSLNPVLDPAAAVGGTPDGAYPAAVGAATVAVGSAAVLGAERDHHPVRLLLTGGVAGAVLGVIAAIVLAAVRFIPAIQIGLAGAAPGFAAVRGAATGRTHRQLGAGLVLLSLVPFTGPQLLRWISRGGLAGFASLILVVALVTYTAVLSYPLHRLGRALNRGVQA